MAANDQAAKKDISDWKPGSEARAAKDVKADGDFGIPAGTGTAREVEYASGNTKASDPGHAHARAGEVPDGARTAGVGAADSGPGSGSGGDLDPDFIGIGQGSAGLSASGPDDAPDHLGPAASDGSSNEFAGRLPGKHATGNAVVEPARGVGQRENVGKVGGPKRVAGSVVAMPDASSQADSQGADAATNPSASGDDAFAGEVSSGEADGEDNALSPSSDSNGQGRDDDDQ